MSKIEIKNDPKAHVWDRKNQNELNHLRFYIRPDRLRFTHATAKRLGMFAGLKVIFVELGDWYICVSNVGEGYLLNKDSKRSGISISASIIARSILKHIAPGQDRCECILLETQYVFYGKPLYKITNRQIN